MNPRNTPVELDSVRSERDAHTYRLLQAAALIKLFTQVNGREARDLAELNVFFAGTSQPPIRQPIDPASILTADEIAAELRKLS